MSIRCQKCQKASQSAYAVRACVCERSLVNTCIKYAIGTGIAFRRATSCSMTPKKVSSIKWVLKVNCDLATSVTCSRYLDKCFVKIPPQQWFFFSSFLISSGALRCKFNFLCDHDPNSTQVLLKSSLPIEIYGIAINLFQPPQENATKLFGVFYLLYFLNKENSTRIFTS